jgi:hypothetical protein
MRAKKTSYVVEQSPIKFKAVVISEVEVCLFPIDTSDALCTTVAETFLVAALPTRQNSSSHHHEHVLPVR